MSSTSPRIGIGLRAEHLRDFARYRARVDFVELLADQIIDAKDEALAALREVIGPCPITLHGVGMSLGSTDKLDRNYLRRLKRLIKIFHPIRVSDHLCWTSVHGYHFHELLPLPYTDETIRHVAKRIRVVQEVLERPLLIENIATYLNFKDSTHDEGSFLHAVADLADCQVLLDISNIYLNCTNHNRDLNRYLEAVPWNRVTEFHLGGFETRPGYLFDSHAAAIAVPVWHLWKKIRSRCPEAITLIEWDNELPSLATLLKEVSKARRTAKRRAS